MSSTSSPGIPYWPALSVAHFLRALCQGIANSGQAIAGQINAYIMTLLIPSTILTYINADLGPDPNYSWITVVWQLGAAVVVSVGGRLSDIFGRRYFLITGALISIVGCLVGANATSINMMIASGTLFGIGSGFQEMAYACIQEMLPNKYRMMGVGMSAL